MYRTNTPPNPEQMLPIFPVRNGATLNLAFGCFYADIHDVQMHDHMGWPNPDNPDWICQINGRWNQIPEKLGRYKWTKNPIDLIEEGYSYTAEVTFEDSTLASGLDASAWIDAETTNIVRMSVDTAYEAFSDEPKEIKFTLFVKKTDSTSIDAVCHGIIAVLPGAPIES